MVWKCMLFKKKNQYLSSIINKIVKITIGPLIEIFYDKSIIRIPTMLPHQKQSVAILYVFHSQLGSINML